MANMAKNVQLLFVVAMVVVTGYLALSVRSAEASKILEQRTSVSDIVEDCLSPANAQFDYFRLALQWPPTHCKYYGPCTVKPLPQTFIIHGLWPDNYQGGVPTKCPGRPYADITDAMLLEKMEKDWPSLEGANSALWKLEWEEHGTCSLSQYQDQNEYFKRAVNFYSRYNVLDKLNLEGINPGPGLSYEADRIKETIKALTTASPDLGCYTEIRTGKQYLHEVYICFTPAGAILTCPPNRVPVASLCTAPEIYFPATVDYPEVEYE